MENLKLVKEGDLLYAGGLMQEELEYRLKSLKLKHFEVVLAPNPDAFLSIDEECGVASEPISMGVGLMGKELLTPAQARELAKILIEASDAAERFKYNGHYIKTMEAAYEESC